MIFVAHRARRFGRGLDLHQPRPALADMAIAALTQARHEQIGRLLRSRRGGMTLGAVGFLVRIMVEPALLQEARRLVDRHHAPAVARRRREDRVTVVTGPALREDRAHRILREADAGNGQAEHDGGGEMARLEQDGTSGHAESPG